MQRPVIHTIESLGRGGAETALVAGLPALKQRGFDVSVVALGPPDTLAPDLVQRGIPVSFGRLALFRQLQRTRGRKPIVHSHLFFANAVARVACAVARAPLVTTFHNAGYGAEGPGRFGLRLKLDRALLAIKRPTYISVSDSVRQDYARYLGVTSTVCPNALDPFWLERPPTRDEARRRLALDDGRPVVFACGRLHLEKGVDLLAAVAAMMPEVRFVVAGSGPAEDLVRQTGPVELLGPQPRTQVRDWLAACDLVAIPSRLESFGIFALEAMALGTPIVATDIPGLRDTLSTAARLVPPNDVPELAEAIRQLLSDPAERRRLGALGAARAPQFSAEAWATRHASVYEGL